MPLAGTLLGSFGNEPSENLLPSRATRAATLAGEILVNADKQVDATVAALVAGRAGRYAGSSAGTAIRKEALDASKTTGHIVGMAKPNVRERLLDAGVEAFHRRGFNGCGVQEITEAAGVPKGSFYNHFASKEALGAAVLDRYWQQRGDTRPCASLRTAMFGRASACGATSPRWPAIWQSTVLPGAA